jgi:hypothetical protein
MKGFFPGIIWFYSQQILMHRKLIVEARCGVSRLGQRIFIYEI